MIKNKLFLITWGLLFLAIPTIQAQNVFMTIDEQTELQRYVNLNGKASAVFVSSINDLVIISNKKEDKFTQKKNGQMYEYETLIDIADGDRTFKVMRKNTALTAEVKKIFTKKNQRHYFKVEVVDNPIILNEQGGRAEAYLVNGKACVEFTTSIENLKVEHPKGLPCTIQRSKSEAGANVISVIVDMIAFDKLRNAMNEAAEEYNAQDAKIQEMGEKGIEIPDVEWQKLDELQKKTDAADVAFNSVSSLTVYADKSNYLSVSIRDLSVKQKLLYGILPLLEKVEIYNRSYDQYVGSAQQAEKSRKFNTAQEFYEQGANATDATEEEKSACRAKASEMKECAGYWNMANQVLNKLKELQKQGGRADYGMIEECYEVAIANYESLYKIRNDEEFQRRATVLKNALDKLGLVIEGNVVKTDMKQGRLLEEPATDVSIYACTSGFNKDMKKGKHGTYIGKVDAKGNFHVQVDRHVYAGLLFVPDDAKNNTWISLHEQKHLKTKVRIKD